jgi:hypothetical protein
MHMTRVFLTLVSVLLFALPAMAQEAPVYTYVAHWNVPRAQWAEFIEFGEENALPVLERMLADGTIVAWGNFATEVHVQDGRTHVLWWSASSIAGIEQTLDELRKLPENPAAAKAQHSDSLLRSPIHRGRATGPTSGYLWGTSVKVRPGKGREWYELWEKYFKPTYDELLDNGTILMYQMEIEVVHTEDPRWRYIVYVAPNAEALDKVNAAFVAVFQKNPTLGAALGEVAVRSAHRDFFARVLNYAHK